MRSVGIDIGKISFKAVWFEDGKIKELFWKVHNGEIEEVWQKLKDKWQIKEDRLVVTGRFRQMLAFPSIPERVAQEKALSFLYPSQELTLIRLGGGGFSVLKTRDKSRSEWLVNPRCAAGTGSFLDQILSRLGLNILQVDELVKEAKGLEITSRCGVTMKTDFTHLLNQGNPVKEVVAGLIDSLAKNAIALISKSPNRGKILIIGGLSGIKRIVQTIRENLKNLEVEVPCFNLYFEALGAALIAEEEKSGYFKNKQKISSLVFLPGLKNYLNQVKKIELPSISDSDTDLVLGLDIGSTGSKLVILAETPVFEAYCETKGNPVRAAKTLIQKVPSQFLNQIKAVGCTGSGREIVGPLLRTSLGEENKSSSSAFAAARLAEENQKQIFILNEIAAHAAGAVYYDKGVDTVVDIGGQDSKFIRIEQGRVNDFAMNTVCSAGTGSFIAEQLQVLGIGDVKEFGKMALESQKAVDLGQHCAIFIAEQIDEAKRKGAKLGEIVAGLYYSIIQNYNNRVKGLRDYGRKIFLQGKPAENLALAAALAKITGQEIIVPDSPGSIGALGIAILTKNELGNLKEKLVLNFEKFLQAEIVEKKEFRCQSKDGCQIGNQCPINKIKVKVKEQLLDFFWGGRCDKYEKIAKNLFLAQAPQPFLQREKLISGIIKEKPLSKKTIGIPRGLETEEILPLIITFFQEIGFAVRLLEKTDLSSLNKGSKLCQASFCAPLQIWAGQAKELEKENYLFLPKIIEILAEKREKRCYVCPLSQACPDMFGPRISANVLQPFLNFKDGYQKNAKEFLKIGQQLGCSAWQSRKAFQKAVKVQLKFEESLREIGKEALEFGRKNQIPVVVVLGHPYIVNSSLLSAGIPETIFEKAGIALPAECYPLEGKAPNLDNIYWGYGHRLLDVAYEVRRQPGVFPLWLSVYSCGPDSFLIHFFQYLSSGKPYTILESDAYTGQAGFKTRIEAFLYTIKNYQLKKEDNLPDLSRFEIKQEEVLNQSKKRKILIPWMGEGSKIASSLLKTGLNLESEYIPLADEKSLELGRKYTSGKECLPMIVTIGSLLKYLKEHPEEKFSYFMPKAGGPCRFGQYQLLTKIILEKLGLTDQVNVISPSSETGYQITEKLNKAMIAKSWTAMVLVDLLKDSLHEIRPVEKIAGETEKIFDKYLKKTEEIILETKNDWSGFRNLWGMENLARMATSEFKKIPQSGEKKSLVLVTGEIYVRLDEFSNGRVIKELEGLGLKTKLAPFREWINYTTFQRRKKMTTVKQELWKVYLTWFLQKKIETRLYQIFAQAFGWQKDHQIDEILKTAEPYLTKLRPLGESALTIGLPLLLWKKKEINGLVLVGPFECMPTRIAETQLGLISEQTGLPILSLSFYGEPLDRELLESFAWDLKS